MSHPETIGETPRQCLFALPREIRELKANKLGLILLTASLAAIVAIAAIVMHGHKADRIESIQDQGVSLVRAMSAVPFSSLIDDAERQGLMRVVKHGTAQTNFAYVGVSGTTGAPINEVAADGLIPPLFEVPREPSSWLGQRIVPTGTNGDVAEFHAPIIETGELRGFVRAGYFLPASVFDIIDVSYLATVALPVFLLVPLFYFLIRTEVQPLRTASAEMSRMLEDESLKRLEISASGELGEFMGRFNRLLERANERITSLEGDQHQLVTSNKLLTYRKSRVESVLETLPEAVVILDESGQISYANQKTAAMFNVPRETIIDRPPQDWCGDAGVLRLLSSHADAGGARSLAETVRFRIDRSAQRSIATRAYPLFSPRDPAKTIGTLVVFQDETKEALARQAREEFVTDLAHELKSPLNAMALYSEALLSDQGREEEFRVEAANVIADEVHRLGKLTTGLLSMTQIETGSLKPDKSLVRLRDVAEHAFTEAKSLPGAKSLKFAFDAPRELSPVFVDKDLLRIAINNLLSNAVKYNRVGGKVDLTIAETDDAVQIRVSDTGIGIADTDAERVFDKFFRSSDPTVQKVGGHGMGLALTRKIVELHHGTMSVNTDVPEGTEFIINLWKDSAASKQAI